MKDNIICSQCKGTVKQNSKFRKEGIGGEMFDFIEYKCKCGLKTVTVKEVLEHEVKEV